VGRHLVAPLFILKKGAPSCCPFSRILSVGLQVFRPFFLPFSLIINPKWFWLGKFFGRGFLALWAKDFPPSIPFAFFLFWGFLYATPTGPLFWVQTCSHRSQKNKTSSFEALLRDNQEGYVLLGDTLFVDSRGKPRGPKQITVHGCHANWGGNVNDNSV